MKTTSQKAPPLPKKNFSLLKFIWSFFQGCFLAWCIYLGVAVWTWARSDALSAIQQVSTSLANTQAFVARLAPVSKFNSEKFQTIKTMWNQKTSWIAPKQLQPAMHVQSSNPFGTMFLMLKKNAINLAVLAILTAERAALKALLFVRALPLVGLMMLIGIREGLTRRAIRIAALTPDSAPRFHRRVNLLPKLIFLATLSWMMWPVSNATSMIVFESASLGTALLFGFITLQATTYLKKRL